MKRLDEIEATAKDLRDFPHEPAVAHAASRLLAHHDVPALVAALRAVLKVHARLTHPFYAQDVCAHPSCTDQDDHMDQAPWPCPTVTAIRQHLGEEA